MVITRSKIPASARRRLIKESLEDQSSVSISGLAVELGVSEMTIRRDLESLQQTADIRRTHGGAVVAERMVFEFTYQARQRENLRLKQRIAAGARKLIQPGERIILDTGTTTLELARLLKDCEAATLITPSLAVASELQFCEALSVILLGGVIHRGSPDLTGPVTEHGLELFAADWVFQGAEAISPGGTIYNVDLQLAQVDRKMRTCAARKCLLVDSSKIGGTALVKNGTLSDFDTFITDSHADPGFLRKARKMTRRVIVV